MSNRWRNVKLLIKPGAGYLSLSMLSVAPNITIDHVQKPSQVYS